jgi:hypothetical protein
MTRLASRTAHAALLTANGVCLAVLAPDAARTSKGDSLLDVLGAVVLCYVGTVALVHTCALAWHLGRADACRWRHRRQPTPGRRTVPRAPVVEQQHAEAMAAVAAEPMRPLADTAVMPVVQTAPTWGFGPYRVVDAPPVAWTAPVAMGARHAGRAA